LVQDAAKGQLMAIDPFTRTVAWTIDVEEGSTRADVADDNSFLLLSSATGLATWSTPALEIVHETQKRIQNGFRSVWC
jgi:hypothetical protein